MKKRSLMLALTLAALPVHAQAQTQAGSGDPRTTPNPSLPVPDELQLSRLVWSTMAAIDHANRSGNYSVLRDIGATGFQVQNTAAQLASIFQSIRERQIDLTNTLLLAPTFTVPPQMVSADVMRLQGTFGLRPISIRFDLYYQWQQNSWRLYGVGIQPVELVRIQPDGSQ